MYLVTIVTISGVIGFDVTPNSVREQLKNVKDDIIVEIGSPGGFVFDGLEIFNILRDFKGGKVETRLMGLAASMAAVIALAGDKVTAHDNAVFMIHNALNLVIGNHNDMREMADHLEAVSNNLAKVFVRKSGKSIKEIKQLMDDETFFFGDEALEAGFVDEIIETENEKDKDSAIMTAMASISTCRNVMQESENVKDDLRKAAALFLPAGNIIKPKADLTSDVPIIEDKNKKESSMTTLEDVLNHKDNIGAKAEYEKNLKDAETKGIDAGEKNVQARIEKAKNFLANEKYPTVAALAMLVVTGEANPDTLIAAVAAIDATTLNKEGDDAADDTAETAETPAEQTTDAAKTEASFQAKKDRV